MGNWLRSQGLTEGQLGLFSLIFTLTVIAGVLVGLWRVVKRMLSGNLQDIRHRILHLPTRLKEYIASLKEFIASPESLVSSLRALCGALFGLVTAAGLAYLSWSWVIRNMPPAVQDMEKRSLGVLLIAAWGTWSVMAAGLCAIAIPFLLLACVLLLLFLRAKKARQPH